MTELQTLELAQPGPAVLATGAWFKNAVCAMRGTRAWLSPSVGDLNTPEACVAHEAAVRELLDVLGETPAAVAHDLHPDFHSSRNAVGLAQRFGVPAIAVQHHHAHIGALCAEHGVEGPVLGIALDGVGLGSDGKPWGGELLRVDGPRFERLGWLRPLALPGGDRAAREPWRVAASVLHALGREGEIATRFGEEPAAPTIVAMIEKGVNCPATSSAGRLFDAAAGLLGLSRRMAFEAEAAIKLEQAATRHIEAHGWPAPAPWQIHADGQLDLFAMLGALTDAADVDAAAARFHATLAAALADWARRAADSTGIGVVACGGGCFLNKLLYAGLRDRLAADDFRVLMVERVSPGDAGIALGQAWIAQRSL